jgi:hypothetical protein
MKIKYCRRAAGVKAKKITLKYIFRIIGIQCGLRARNPGFSGRLDISFLSRPAWPDEKRRGAIIARQAMAKAIFQEQLQVQEQKERP